MSRVAPALIADLELDLEVFSGPFDLLLTLVLREEVDLLEVELADVVLSYLDFLEARGELDLEAATEFLLLIAALLELKSRLMLPREEDELLDLEPGEAAEELLARMLEAAATAGRRSTWPTGWPTRTAIASAPRRCRRPCAASPTTMRARSTSPRSSAPPSAPCCACRRRSASPTSRSRASPWPSGWRTCACCCAAAPARSTRRCAAPTA